MTTFDGIIPTKYNIGNYITQQHIMRYVFAKDYVKNKIVLDVACGAGYGTQYLAQDALKVYGVDIDEKALKIAKMYYTHDKVEYIKGNVLSLPFKDNLFDVVVSFETIEHLKNPQDYVSEIKRVLCKRGIFICSTPNIKYTKHPWYHLHEFYSDEFFKLMKQNFSYVEMYGQYISRLQRFKDIISDNTIVRKLDILRNYVDAKFKYDYLSENPVKINELRMSDLVKNKVIELDKGSGILRIMICVCKHPKN